MANVFNKETKVFLTSVNKPDYLEGGKFYDINWIVLDRAWYEKYTLPKCNSIYWNPGDNNRILEMTPLEKAIVDENNIRIPYDFASVMKRIYTNVNVDQKERIEKMLTKYLAMFRYKTESKLYDEAKVIITEATQDNTISFFQEDENIIKAQLPEAIIK